MRNVHINDKFWVMKTTPFTEFDVANAKTKLAKTVVKEHNKAVRRYGQRLKKMLAEIVQSVPFALTWNSELLGKAYNLVCLWQQAVATALELKTNRAVKEALIKLRDDYAVHMARFPHRHSSTLAASNMMDECAAHAKSEFICEISGLLKDHRYF